MHLAFRDHLRARPEVAEQYGELKWRLAADRLGYTNAKSTFVEDVLGQTRD